MRSLFSSRYPAVLAPLALVVGLGLAPSRVHAQTTASETARVTDLFKSGKAAFSRGDIAEARRLFAEAWGVRKSADIAANLGQSELELGEYRGAAEHLQWALANLLPSATDTQRKAVETGLARARAETSVLRLDIKPDGSDVLVGEQNLGKSPIASSVFVDSGEVIVSVKHDGFVALEKRVIAAKGTEQAVEISLAAKTDGAGSSGGAIAPAIDSGLDRPLAADAPHEHAHAKSLVPAFVATGVAVAGGALGLALTLHANAKASDADHRRDSLQAQGGCGETGTAPEADCNSLLDQRKSVDTSRNIGIAAFIVGGVAALGAGYFYWDALAHRRASAARLGPLRALEPRLDLGARSASTSIESVKLGVSGTF